MLHRVQKGRVNSPHHLIFQEIRIGTCQPEGEMRWELDYGRVVSVSIGEYPVSQWMERILIDLLSSGGSFSPASAPFLPMSVSITPGWKLMTFTFGFSGATLWKNCADATLHVRIH